MGPRQKHGADDLIYAMCTGLSGFAGNWEVFALFGFSLALAWR